MKGLYIYDLKFLYNPENGNYYTKSFSNEMWEIYLKEIQEIDIYNTPRIINENKSNLPKVDKQGLKVINYPWWQKKNKVIEFLKFFKYLRKTKEIAIIIRVPSIKGSLIGLACVLLKKKYLVEVVGDAYGAMYYHGTIKGKVIAPFFEIITKILVSRASTVTYITKKYLQQKYPNSRKTYTVPNVRIDTPEEKVLEQKLQNIQNVKTKSVIKIGLIGSLEVKYKGHEIAIQAIEELNNKYQGVYKIKLELVGEGNISNAYSNSPYVLHHGVLNKNNLIKFLKEIDIYIQPSLTEAQGRSIIEAMSLGTPVVASKVGGVVELLDPRYLVEPGNSKELIEKISLLINNNELLREQAVRNFEEAKQYELSKVNKKREEALKGYKATLLI